MSCIHRQYLLPGWSVHILLLPPHQFKAGSMSEDLLQWSVVVRIQADVQRWIHLGAVEEEMLQERLSTWHLVPIYVRRPLNKCVAYWNISSTRRLGEGVVIKVSIKYLHLLLAVMLICCCICMEIKHSCYLILLSANIRQFYYIWENLLNLFKIELSKQFNILLLKSLFFFSGHNS